VSKENRGAVTGYLVIPASQDPKTLAFEIQSYEAVDGILLGVQDYRGDEEGLIYPPGQLSLELALKVEAERSRRARARERAVGYITQPIPREENHEPSCQSSESNGPAEGPDGEEPAPDTGSGR